jgi:isopentenyl diphosphate isomerase/L-lactate dehydrogenase-like FMN-dependent dehydrogenase
VTSTTQKPAQVSLGANALGLGGAVITSAAIMGPAVSTFLSEIPGNEYTVEHG